MRRDGHLIEVIISRPAARNGLHPMANDELEHVFDCYSADDDLWWVAILTGAGDKAFSAGNDLVYSASRSSPRSTGTRWAAAPRPAAAARRAHRIRNSSRWR